VLTPKRPPRQDPASRSPSSLLLPILCPPSDHSSRNLSFPHKDTSLLSSAGLAKWCCDGIPVAVKCASGSLFVLYSNVLSGHLRRSGAALGGRARCRPPCRRASSAPLFCADCVWLSFGWMSCWVRGRMSCRPYAVVLSRGRRRASVSARDPSWPPVPRPRLRRPRPPGGGRVGSPLRSGVWAEQDRTGVFGGQEGRPVDLPQIVLRKI